MINLKAAEQSGLTISPDVLARVDDVAPNLMRVPKPSTKSIQFIIDGQFKDKNRLPRPEIFVDTAIIDQLERSGFIDAVYR